MIRKRRMKNTETENVFSNMLRLQVIATFVLVIVLLAVYGLHAGVSSLIGGGSVIIAAFVASKIVKTEQTTPSAALFSLLKAELVKILIIIVVLLIAFNMYQQLVSPALIGGLAAAALISGAATSKLNKAGLKI